MNWHTQYETHDGAFEHLDFVALATFSSEPIFELVTNQLLHTPLNFVTFYCYNMKRGISSLKDFCRQIES